jgi:hypothetical protein
VYPFGAFEDGDKGFTNGKKISVISFVFIE